MAAGDAVIGALRVTLAADTADFDTGLKSTGIKLAAFAGAVAGATAVVAKHFIEMAVEAAKALPRIVDDMDKLNKSSQKLGISVEELSKLAFAADLADVSFEGLSKGVVKLSKAMVEAAANPASETAAKFKSLGIEVRTATGALKSSDDILVEVADKFATLKDGAGKTAASVALFGKAGAELIPLLNGGGKAIQDAKNEAQAFGIVVSATAAKAAEDLNDNLKRLAAITKGIFVQSLEQVLPTLANFSAQMVEVKKNSGLLETGIFLVSTAFKALITTGVLVDALFTRMIESFKGLLGAIGFAMAGGFTKAFEALKAGSEKANEATSKAMSTIKGLWDGSTKASAEATLAHEKASKSLKDYEVATTVAKNAVDNFISSQAKGLAGHQAEILTFGQLAGAKEALKIQLQAEAVAKENDLTISARQQAALDLIKQKTSDYAVTLEGLQLKQANLTPAETLIQTQTKINALFDAGAISAETAGRAMQKAAEGAGVSWEMASQTIAGGFGSLAKEFAKTSKSWAATAKALGIFEATVNTYAAFTKALASAPPPLNYALAAATLAAGLAKVIAIKSQTFAKGGIVSGPGTALSDSVPAMLSNGEFVMNASSTEKFRPQLEAMNSGMGAGGGGGKIEISGIRPGELLTTDMAIAMVDKLSQIAGFGYVIKPKGT